jgi:hypothetical protein
MADEQPTDPILKPRDLGAGNPITGFGPPLATLPTQIGSHRPPPTGSARCRRPDPPAVAGRLRASRQEVKRMRTGGGAIAPELPTVNAMNDWYV